VTSGAGDGRVVMMVPSRWLNDKTRRNCDALLVTD
jgi:hypothetical protein